MNLNETMHLPSGRTVIVAAICFVLLSTAFAQGAVEANANALRHLKGRTIVSEKFPKVQLTVGRGFIFVGKQQVNRFPVPFPDHTGEASAAQERANNLQLPLSMSALAIYHSLRFWHARLTPWLD
jgi:hypothetical protein